jgi:hypothetical protein
MAIVLTMALRNILKGLNKDDRIKTCDVVLECGQLSGVSRFVNVLSY